jgi:hypothetical protein
LVWFGLVWLVGRFDLLIDFGWFVWFELLVRFVGLVWFGYVGLVWLVGWMIGWLVG